MEWKKVYETQNPFQAEIVKSVLEAHGLNPVSINKQDSSYVGAFGGNFEIHVPAENFLKSLKIIQDEVQLE